MAKDDHWLSKDVRDKLCAVPLASWAMDCPAPTDSLTVPITQKPWVIVLDSGHGKYQRRNFDKPGSPAPVVNDPGASIPGHKGFYERDLNDITVARTALALRAQNTRHGGNMLDVILTRRIDLSSPHLDDLKAPERRYLETLNARTYEAVPDMYETRLETGKKYGKVLHLSVHADTHPAPKTKPGEEAVPAPKGVAFYTYMYAKPGNVSEQWARALQEGFEERGLMTTLSYGKVSGYAPIRDEDGKAVHGIGKIQKQIINPSPQAGHNYPGIGDVRTGLGDYIGGVIYEAGNVQNPKDLARMLSPKGGREAARLLAEGITDFIAPRNLGVLMEAAHLPVKPPGGRGR